MKNPIVLLLRNTYMRLLADLVEAEEVKHRQSTIIALQVAQLQDLRKHMKVDLQEVRRNGKPP